MLQCPLKRKPSHYIPPYYKPQAQYILEICDLEHLDFVQYRPPGEQGEAVFCVTRVERDREWFRQQIPTVRHFCHVIRDFLAHPEALGMLREEKDPDATLERMLEYRPFFTPRASVLQTYFS